MARVGGINFPKQYQQFEAIAYSNGADGKPDTKDDIELGPSTWSGAWKSTPRLSTMMIRSTSERWTTMDCLRPTWTGRIRKRRNHADNYGDVWVVASYTLPDGIKMPASGRGRICWSPFLCTSG